MKIRPIYISLFLVLVLSVLFGLTFISTESVIDKGQFKEDGFVLSNFTLKYPTYQKFIYTVHDSVFPQKEFKQVTSNVKPIEENEILVTDTIVFDTISNKPVVKAKRLDFNTIDTTLIERISYPDSIDFVSNLYNDLVSHSCRILHYGDSQLEGDRITAYLRNRLQTTFGGSGPGFMPLKPVYNQSSAVVIPSDNWLRYARFDPTQEKFDHKKYGAFMSVSRFTPYVSYTGDSLKNTIDSLKLVRASVKIGKSNNTYIKFRRFTKIDLHYGNAIAPVTITVRNNGNIIQQDSLQTDGKYHTYAIRLPSTPTNLNIEFEAKISPDFYGITLDGHHGVQIDNIAMRGSSGTIFASTNAVNYSQMMRALQPKLVIMQYGGNTVPYLKDSIAVQNYTKYVIAQVNWMRRRTIKDPNFLFIGPTDMCTPINGEMTTYPLLPYLNKELRKNCLENNIAYWSMYDAMGGQGSMIYWVDQKLAANDYTHFTRRGTKIISELLFTALYLDLKKHDPNAIL